MLKYVSKFTLDVLPSLLATVIGAYIVNHYIVSKPDTPVAAATSTTNPANASKAEPSADVANIPEPGVRAKGISEKAVLDKSAAEKPAAEKTADKPAETASIPSETRRHQPAAREKTVAKTVPVPRPLRRLVLVAATPRRRRANAARRGATPWRSATPTISPVPRSSAARHHRQFAACRKRSPQIPRIPDAPGRAGNPVEASRIVPAPSVPAAPPPISGLTPPGEGSIRRPHRRGKPPRRCRARIATRAVRRRQPIFWIPRRRSACRGDGNQWRGTRECC